MVRNKKEVEEKETKKKGTWYSTGKEGIAKSKQEDEISKQRRQQRKDQVWRFHLDNNEENVKGTLLDTPKFFFREHNVKVGTNFMPITCLMDFDTCPLDSAFGNSSYCVAGTIIDHRKRTDKNEEVHENEKRMVVFKGKAREKIVRLIESKEDLQYCVMNFSRGSSQTECGTGEDIEVLKKLDRDKLKAFIPKGETMKWLEPFDYAKLLAPKSPEELRKLIGQAPPVGSAEETEGKEDKSTKKGKKVEEDKPIESIEDLL